MIRDKKSRSAAPLPTSPAADHKKPPFIDEAELEPEDDGNLSVISGLDSRLRGNDVSNYLSFTRKFTLDVPSGPGPKPQPSPLRKQGSRKKPHRRIPAGLRTAGRPINPGH